MSVALFVVDGIEYHPTGSLFRTGLYSIKADIPQYPPDKIDEEGFLRIDLIERSSRLARESMTRWPDPFPDHDLDDEDNRW